MEIKDRFVKIITDMGISQQEMAERIGVDASTISYFCKGKRKPGFDILERIAVAFPDVDLNWLITGVASESHITCQDQGDSQISNSQNSIPGQLQLDFSPSQVRSSITSIAPATSAKTYKEKPANPQKRIKRVIVLFDDGTMESYNDL
ncbi:MAG: helix-turn-helix transcriptional regulator [Marinifilaceae bacterium]|nr:helix-turn-helix transcriptional regulator [Marinifilaceae bacterium]